MTTARPTAPGGLGAGDVLAGRYVLLEQVGSGPTSLWRADDDVLARPVAVRLADASGDGGRQAAQPMLDAAVRTGAATHPGLVRVYDAAAQDATHGSVAYVISEWVEGRRLDDLLGDDGPLEAPEAADLVRRAADALTTAHARGLSHGRLHPGNVLVTGDGRVRLTDLEVAAELAGERTGSLGGVAGAVERDTRDLAGVAFALVSGRWPPGSPQPAGSLATAGSTSARQVRAGVPRELDAVLSRALSPAPAHPGGPPTTRTPALLADAVDRAVAPAREARRAALTARGPGRLRRALPWLVAGAIVTGVGTAGWLLGLAVGDLPRQPGGVESIVSTSTAPTPAAGRPPAAGTVVDLTRVAIRDFDPPPGDGSESPDQVRNAVDLDATTAWTTSRYDSAPLGGLKPGVGLLLDLGRPTTLSRVQVGFTAPGTSVEVRTADAVGTSASAYRLVGAVRDAGQVASLALPAGSRGRYWLVWLTRLPKVPTGYRAGIAELRFTRS